MAQADQDRWIQNLAQLSTGFGILSKVTLVVPESTYVEHKKILLKRLQENATIIMSDEIRKKVIIYLSKDE
jgi:hypothetical protein